MKSKKKGEGNGDVDTIAAHILSADDAIAQLRADARNGLSPTEAKSRLEAYGPNELNDGSGVQPLKILLRQIANAMILVLILALAVSFAIRSWIEGGVISAVVFLNIVVGFYQEYAAEKTMDSLRSLMQDFSFAPTIE